MGIGSRPASCASCGKRLNRKQWYYRNGKFFCKKRCFGTEQEKAATEAAKAAAAKAEAKEKETVAESAKETPAAS